MKSEISLDIFFSLGFVLLVLFFIGIKDKNSREPFKGYKVLWAILASLTLFLFLLKTRKYGLPGILSVLTQSEILLNLIICLGTSFGVLFFLWIRESNKWEFLKGYIIFWTLPSFGSFLLVQLIFKDYGLSGFIKFLMAFCFTLMSTYSPYYLILAKGDKNEKKKLEEIYFKKK